MLTALFFFFNDTATTEIYTLSLHDALPISGENATEVTAFLWPSSVCSAAPVAASQSLTVASADADASCRSEEHTSELQSQSNLVCRLLLEKKKKNPWVGQSDRYTLALVDVD